MAAKGLSTLVHVPPPLVVKASVAPPSRQLPFVKRHARELSIGTNVMLVWASAERVGVLLATDVVVTDAAGLDVVTTVEARAGSLRNGLRKASATSAISMSSSATRPTVVAVCRRFRALLVVALPHPSDPLGLGVMLPAGSGPRGRFGRAPTHPLRVRWPGRAGRADRCPERSSR